MGKKARLWFGIPIGFAVASLGALMLAHFRSPYVKSWSLSKYGVLRGQPLSARVFGSGSTTVLLLHGLGATGDYFGADYDELGSKCRVIVPDLLGFGRSLDEDRDDFSLNGHFEALDSLLDLHAPQTRQLIIGGHSMGSGLAVGYANRHKDLVTEVFCWGAPIYPTAEAATESIASMGMMERLFVVNQFWAKRICGLNCSNRRVAGWLAAAISPTQPLPIARNASLHSWPAYQQSLTNLILEFDWSQQLEQLGSSTVPVSFSWGEHDAIGDQKYVASIIKETIHSATRIPEAGHQLPITHSQQLVNDLISVCDS